MRRVVSVWLPDLSTDRLISRSSGPQATDFAKQPLVMRRQGGSCLVVAAANPAARARGLLYRCGNGTHSETDDLTWFLHGLF